MKKPQYSFRVGGSNANASAAAIKAPLLSGGSAPVTRRQQTLPLSLAGGGGGNRPVNRTVRAVLRQAGANGGSLG
ncbi:MAG: hypothetical protein WA082_00665 [Candidatus Moraniibacteriota bacterium]